MRFLFLLVLLSFCLSAQSQDLKTEFVVQYSGEGNNEVFDIAADESSNVYSTGVFEKTIYFGDSNLSFTAPFFKDGFVTKTDRCGNTLWAKHYSGKSQVLPEAIKIDSKGFIYVVGTFSGTTDFEPGSGNFIIDPNGGHAFFITKHNQAGDLIWVKRIGGSSGMYSPDFDLDSEDNLYISGSFTYTVDFDPGAGEYNLSANGLDAFVVKLNSNGVFVWAKQFTGNGSPYHCANAVDKNGNCYISGRFSGGIDFDPSQNEFKLATGDSGNNIFVVTLDRNGNFKWAKKIAVELYFYVDIAVDANENVYVTSNFKGTVNLDPSTNNHILSSNGGYDVLVVKLNSSGNLNWAKNMGGQGDDYGLSLYVDTSDNIYSTGFFYGIADFDPGNNVVELNAGSGIGQYISILNNGGEFMWAGANSGNGQTIGHAIKVNEFGIFSVGGFSGITDFKIVDEKLELTAVSQYDGFIQKLSTNHIRNLFEKEEKYICKEQDLELTPNYQKYDEFLWNTNEITPTITVNQEGLYYLEVKNCNQTFRDSLEVKYLSEEDCNPFIYIPNAFSPNGDGLNEIFKISHYGFQNFDCHIFSQTGQIVAYSTNLDAIWDGKMLNLAAPIGSYTYIINAITSKGETIERSGRIILLE